MSSTINISGMSHDDLEDIFSKEHLGNGRGRGKKARSRKSGTPKAAISQAVENSQMDRQERAKVRLLNDLAHFPKGDSKEAGERNLELYYAWINSCLEQGELVFDLDKDIEIKNAKSSKKAGGQRLNKSSTAVLATHIPSGIKALIQQGSTHDENERLVTKIIIPKLEQHMRNWEDYLQGKSGTMVETSIKELLCTIIPDHKDFIQESLNSSKPLDEVKA